MPGAILITGAAGFIGQNLVQNLSEHYDKECLVLQTRSRLQAKVWQKQGYKIWTCDLAAFPNFKNFPQVDCVVHTVGSFQENPQDLLEKNILSTLNLLKWMTRFKVNKIIFLSSAAVYGSGTKPWKENQFLNPVTLYGQTKLTCEHLIGNWTQEAALRSSIILRCNNIYGPLHRQGIVYSLLHKITNQQPVFIDGKGDQIRQPLFVQDLCRAIELALNYDKKKCSIFNISGKESVSLNQLCLKAAQAAKTQLIKKYSNRKAGLPKILKLDTSLAKKELKWQATTNLIEGISKTINS